MNKRVFKRKKTSLKVQVFFLIIVYLCSNILMVDNSIGEDSLAVQSRFKLFFQSQKHRLDIQNIATVVMAASKLRELVIEKDVREGELYSEITALNDLFSNAAVRIENTIKVDKFRCSGREFKYAVFHFKEKEEPINVLFLQNGSDLDPSELAELRINNNEKHYLDHPGFEGVWFVDSRKMNIDIGEEIIQLRREFHTGKLDFDKCADKLKKLLIRAETNLGFTHRIVIFGS